jgi:hypothetical protein
MEPENVIVLIDLPRPIRQMIRGMNELDGAGGECEPQTARERGR